MKLAEEIAYDIWSSDGFKTDLSRLIEKSILKDLSSLALETQQTEEPFDSTALARLLQSAAIFADTSHEGFREAAQRICTAALKIWVLPGFPWVTPVRNWPGRGLDRHRRSRWLS